MVATIIYTELQANAINSLKETTHKHYFILCAIFHNPHTVYKMNV